MERIELFSFSAVFKRAWTSFTFLWLVEMGSTGMVRNIRIAMKMFGKASSIEYVWMS